MKVDIEIAEDGNPIFHIRSRHTAWDPNFLYLDVWQMSLDNKITHPRAWALKWILQREDGTPPPIPKKIIYGQIPGGYTEEIAPRRLEIGCYYRFDKHFFKKISDKEFEFLSQKEFDQLRYGSPHSTVPAPQPSWLDQAVGPAQPYKIPAEIPKTRKIKSSFLKKPFGNS